ncbi:MAG: OsmC family protein [Candidatus Cloacimonetes bacterium]|jgi:putative redox protein|nr:OsmC family protein [Candidatus Cloacimonadota bacterium]MDY0173001.1 OsmC family protein [Candidatus Cloacimonadaceae bacterium]
MATTVVTKWTGGLSFDSLVAGHHVILDASKEGGGQDTGARPKALLLTAIAGCSGMDIVSILGKMKIKDYTFEMDVDGESTTEHPIVFHTITVKYKFSGKDLPPDRILRAVSLSNDTYCGATAMLRKAAEIVVKIYINDEEIT